MKPPSVIQPFLTYMGNPLMTRVRPFFNPHRAAFAVLSAFLLTFALASSSVADPCEVNDPSGTVTLPPVGCEYLAAEEVYEIVDGLPPGTTIELAPIHKDFICSERALSTHCDIPAIPGVSCEMPGGDLGGNAHCFTSSLQFQVTGTDTLAGFSRTITVEAPTVVDTGPRTPGDPVQSFDTEMVALQAELFGDPDFCVLHIRQGRDFGLPPSFGHTTLTNIGGDNWSVDSFFDITYEISFQGCPGSVLEGFSGTTQGTIRMQAGEPQQPIPTLSQWGVITFGTLLLGAMAWTLSRRQAA